MADYVGVSEMFENECVLVTGGSGFMGKVLLEKLLRSCPGVKTVYVLLREKRGKSPEDRLNDIVRTPLFEPLLRSNPASVEKLRAVVGDCAALGLGLKAEDEQRLVEDVAFVFHAAASVRFDEPIQRAILLNTRGTREVVALARRMPRLKVLQYVSTTFCNIKEPVVREEVFPALHDWRTMIHLSEKEDPSVLLAMTRKILNWHPNSYLLSKSLAENIIYDARHDIPVTIFRPAVVVSSLQEPFPGWVDSLYGPFALWAGMNKGIVRYVLVPDDVGQTWTFVDWGIRGMLVTAWARAINFQTRTSPDGVDVVNMEHDRRISCQDQTPLIRSMQHFFSNQIRYPRVTVCNSYLHYWIGIMFSHVMFALVMDSALKLSGSKMRLLATYRKIFYSMESLKTILSSQIRSETNSIWQIEKHLRGDDVPSFCCSLNTNDGLKYDLQEFADHTGKGLTKFVFKEKIDIEKSQRRLRVLYVLDIAQSLFFGILFFWTMWRFLASSSASLVDVGLVQRLV